MSKKDKIFKNVIFFSLYLLLSWSLYRLLFHYPQEIDEIIVKPLLWLLPIYYLVRKKKDWLKHLGITTEGLIPSIYFALALGVGFALEGVIVNFFKYKGINFSAGLGQDVFIVAFLLSLATAFTEEITFRGYIFNSLWSVTGNELEANFLSSFVWGLIHIPVAMFTLSMSIYQTVGYVALITLFGFGSAFIFARTKNIFSSILLHIFWAWPIMLFR